MAKGKILKQIAQAPAEVLEKTLEGTEKLLKKIEHNKSVKRAEKYWANLGPGLTTGAADDDPSGIATYSQTGAKYSFNLLWLTAFSFPLMAVVQEMCARIGMVTGRGLAGNIRLHYPKWVLYFCAGLLFFANTFNIGADLGAMAKASQLIFPSLAFPALVIVFSLLSLLLQVFTPYSVYSKYLKWLALILFAYVLSAFFIPLDGKTILFHTLIPHLQFSKDQIFLVCGILGTTISPYLFFWQTSQEVEEEILEGKATIKQREGVSREEIKKMRIDVWSGMFFSNLVMFFIIITCAATLYSHGITNITTAADAATALKPLAGNFAFLLFAIGIIGTGMLAVPVLAGSTAYAISEAAGWKEGLYRKLKKAYAFYGVIIISMVLGLIMNFTKIDPVKALIYSAVLNGLVSPVILILIVHLSSNKKVMRQHANTKIRAGLGWLITAIMIAVAVMTLGLLIIR